ncbi:MAG: glutamine-hydrolyzing GMP synthase [Candidatus Aenigmarchaeota archaeon]|nr:glutamine-hydrolyzing GMP synthase [Candidatus Aenigmarchaeota archaeon]
MADTILVVDCGGQYAHLIARAIRKLHVHSELAAAGVKASSLGPGVKGVIISGGPATVYEKDSPKPEKKLLALGIPVLGICYGHQYIAYALDGKVGKAGKKEFGFTDLDVLNDKGILAGLGKKEKVWMSHGIEILLLPEGFQKIASTENCEIAAFEDARRKIFGIQFHAEVRHTKCGKRILKNFVDICGCKKDWKAQNTVPAIIEGIRNEAGGKKAIVALSGGIDSSTAAMLCHKAIGKNLVAVYIDTGMMREGETRWIEEHFSKLDINLSVIDAKKDFLEALRGITDPEEKRIAIGDTFVDVFAKQIETFGADYLIQGTIYPDRIESAQASRSASKIKTHHNVGSPKIERMRMDGKVIEPLKDFYKDEVRAIARDIGLPQPLIWRQPFPGPGLAARIEGEVTEEKLETVRHADKIVREEIEDASQEGKRPWQYFAVLSNSFATGVKGDERAFGHVVIVRVVESHEAMTANFAKMSWDVLERISTRITNEVPGITRVVYDITHKPPATIEWL